MSPAAHRWTAAEIPPQAGKLALITGANSGIGFHTALELARARCGVILACRDRIRGDAARTRILAAVPSAHVEVLPLDLASLESVRAAADQFLSTGQHLDLLINNAGVMALPHRQLTRDGFELQFGTNHLGHFALAGLLLPALLSPSLMSGAPSSRIVTVSSIAHRGATMDFTNLQWERGYRPWPAYRRSKLANLLFGFELQRRLERAHVRACSVVVHPGVSNTNLFAAGPGQGRGLIARLTPVFIALFAQSDAQGALPTLYAATAPDIRGGRFYGCDGFREMRGYPVEVGAETQAYDEALAAKLWELSESLTGVKYSLPESQP
jgi:NAD(P)-dependent dehydrogenase (short-subunit alcohol dehydrogenase family)